MDVFAELLRFLDQLEQHHLSYQIARVRPDTLLVEVVVPGTHWEVEFSRSGDIEVERFVSNGEIADRSALLQLFEFERDVEV